MTKRFRTPFSYFDLIEMFPKPGCAICNRLLVDVDWYLDSLLYEYANTVPINTAFREGRGLCNEHGWQLKKSRTGTLGVAILYDAVIDEVLKTIEKTPVENVPQSGLARLLNSAPKHSAEALADKLEPERGCLVCDVLQEAEQTYVRILCEYLMDSRMQDAFRASEGLCLPHFRLGLREAQDAERLEVLISIQTTIWANLKAEVQEFIRKNNFQHADEPMGDEGDSWLRAIARMSGEKGVYGMRR